MDLELKRLTSLDDVDSAAWNALADGNPFLRHEFLSALEHTGCVGAGTGWQPSHLIVTAGGRLVGALPLYAKHDSRGEFVFDWSWADAYERAGGRYYPKLVAAIPFTPATGRRLLIAPGKADGAVAARLLDGAAELQRELDASSVHCLFPSDTEGPALTAAGYLPRKSCQFHWHNRGYADFEGFLAGFSSEKRKKARRERRRVAEAGIRFVHARGDELSAEDWDAVFGFHARTFMLRGRPPYLNRRFFDEVARTMPGNVLVILARHQGTPIAAAICFCGGGALYGRYWGGLADFHSLHFETCYYQGIEYCIREGLSKFEPGTQGEHKISRGFTPTATWSWHRLVDPRFRRAVQQFLTRETAQVDAYMDYLDDHVPYRRDMRETDQP
jgi:uncharacterized protein